jgi:hypothetical protein
MYRHPWPFLTICGPHRQFHTHPALLPRVTPEARCGWDAWRTPALHHTSAPLPSERVAKRRENRQRFFARETPPHRAQPVSKCGENRRLGSQEPARSPSPWAPGFSPQVHAASSPTRSTPTQEPRGWGTCDKAGSSSRFETPRKPRAPHPARQMAPLPVRPPIPRPPCPPEHFFTTEAQRTQRKTGNGNRFCSALCVLGVSVVNHLAGWWRDVRWHHATHSVMIDPGVTLPRCEGRSCFAASCP